MKKWLENKTSIRGKRTKKDKIKRVWAKKSRKDKNILIVRQKKNDNL